MRELQFNVDVDKVRSEAEAKAALTQTCVPVTGSLRLILYDDHVAPEKVALFPMDKKPVEQYPVEWRVAPFGGKPGMYRLAPRMDPPPNGYLVVAGPISQSVLGTPIDNYAATKYRGCVMLNVAATEYLDRVERPAKGTAGAGSASTTATEASSSPACSDSPSCASAGRMALAAGRNADAVHFWRKALESGGTLWLPVYHKRTLGCDGGTLALSGDGRVALTDYRSKPVFDVPLSAVACTPWRGVGFTLEAEGKKHSFVYVPDGKPESAATAIPDFDAAGQAIQRTVAQFVCMTVAVKGQHPSAKP